MKRHLHFALLMLFVASRLVAADSNVGNTGRATAVQLRAFEYAWSGNYDASLAQFEHELSADQNNMSLAAGRADVLTWKGDLVAATVAYENLVNITPNNELYLLKLAQIYALQGRTHEAQASYEKVLRHNPDSVDAYIGYANIFMDNHQYSYAEKVLRDGLERFPEDLHLANHLTKLSLERSISFKEKAELVELLVFAVVLFLIARDIWRERRMLRRRKLASRVLVPALLAFLLLMVLVYVDVLFSGTYYKKASIAAELLEPVVLGILLTLTLVWRLRIERPQRQKTVLAIGAHPDDIEFGCGATLLRMRDEGAATYGLVLTGGERGHDEDKENGVRVEEASSAARVLALCDIEVHNFPDTSLHEHKAEIRKTIEDVLARWRPDVIFTHNAHDVHTDHRTVHDAAREAARGACTILCYENPNTPPGFKPGYFYDVGNYIDGKIAALACHKTQMGKSYAASDVVRAMAGFRGTQARVPMAEGFEVMRVLEKEQNTY